MSQRSTFVRLLALGAVLLATTPAARADGEWEFKWGNGFKLSSADEAFELKFGGRAQFDYTFASGDDAFGLDFQDGFEVRRARLFSEGTIYKRVKYKVQFDFAGGETATKDLYIGLVQGWGTLQFGHFHEDFSLEELTSSKYIAFIERSLPVEAFAPSRNAGVGFKGKGSDKLNWGVGYYYDADDFAESVSEDDTNLTARIGFRPLYADKGRRMLHIGLGVSAQDRGGSTRVRARPEAHNAPGRLVDTGSFDATGRTLLGVELAGVFNRFWFASEWMQMDVDAPQSGDPTFSGSYVQAGFYLTDDYRRFKASNATFDRQKPGSIFGMDGKGAWELAVRFSTLDLTDAGIAGGEQDDVTFAINWYLNSATRLMINYVNADVQDVGSADLVLVRWAIDF